MELDRIRYDMPQRIRVDLWNYAGAILASVGYPSLIILAVSGCRSRSSPQIGAVGQMALSNYLLHSVVASIVFLGWGLDLPGGSTTRSSFSSSWCSGSLSFSSAPCGSRDIASARSSGCGDR